MQGTRSAALGDDHLSLGCFEVGGRTYALDVSQLREVLRWQPLTPLPQAPSLIEGVIDLRGAIVPVIDLGRALGVDPVRPGARARIAVAEFEGLLVGLAVDAALEVVAVEGPALGDPPALATQAGYVMARGLVRRADAEPILVLALEHILEGVYRSSLPAPEDSV